MAEIEVLFSNMGDRLIWRRRELRSFSVDFGSTFWIGRHFFTRLPGNISFGNRSSFGQYTQLYSYAPIEIGKDFTSASNLTINTGTHDPVTLAPLVYPVTIGDRVWCGAHVTILGGVTIGNDAVIGAGSLVIGDIPAKAVAVGTPAKVIRFIDRSHLRQIWSWTGHAELD